MKKLYLSFSICASFLLAPLCSDAIPAKPGLIPMKQADGTTINVRLVGDENFHFYLSEDGYLLSNKNNTFYYATVDGTGTTIRSDIKATAPALRTAEANKYLSTVSMPTVLKAMEDRSESAKKRTPGVRKLNLGGSPMKAPQGPGLFPNADFPVTGSPKVLVILVEYKNKKMVVENPYEYFHNMLNQEGFDQYSATGSAIDFFTECSNGAFTPEFDVYGPVTLSQNYSYYGGNDPMGNDTRPEKMIIEACELLDDEIDFSEYDTNGDGYIDNVYVFYAGMGEASGGSADTVWPHSWNISYATSTPYMFDGVRLDRYACSNENEGSRPDGVGTFIHEFSHVMGLPDLYATSYTSAFTPGGWSCMDYGPYNNNGRTPPLYGAFERYALGWMEPLGINGPLTAMLEPIGTNMAGIIKTSDPNEFFLIENRQQTSWDTYIPGHGMLIWHIDYVASVWDRNAVNNTASHQYVDIEEADGTQNEFSRAGDAFPGTSHVTSFTATTKPAMKTWDGQALDLPMTGIHEAEDGNIYFDVSGGGPNSVIDPVEVLEAENITDESFTARWVYTKDATYSLTVFTRDEADGTIVYILRNKTVGSVGSYQVNNLKPDTEYFYTVRMGVGDGWNYSEPSAEVSVYTGKAPLNKLKAVALAATDVTESSFTAHWETLDDATNYELSVYTKEPTGFLHNICDFADGGSKLPEGWSASSITTYAMRSYCGEAAPSLRLGKDGDAITTADVEDGAKRLTFWHRGNKTTADDQIKVYAKVIGMWTLIKTIPITSEAGGAITNIELADLDATAARIEFAKVSNGALAIDDIDLAHGVTLEDTPLPGYETFAAGNVSSHTVTGLKPDTEYYYTITGKNATLASRLSNEIMVKTSGSSMGIDDASTSQAGIVTHGRTLLVVGAGDNATVKVFDLTGRLIASSAASQSITLPDAGLYIVSVPSINLKAKILIK